VNHRFCRNDDCISGLQVEVLVVDISKHDVVITGFQFDLVFSLAPPKNDNFVTRGDRCKTTSHGNGLQERCLTLQIIASRLLRLPQHIDSVTVHLLKDDGYGWGFLKLFQSIDDVGGQFRWRQTGGLDIAQ